MEQDKYFARLEEEVQRRLEKAIEEEGVQFVMRMMKSIYTSPNSALYDMNDYLSKHNF